MRLFEKIIYSISLDILWLRLNNISFKKKIFYIIIKYYKLIIGGCSIPFLSQEHFSYDNKNTPVTLQSYPDEIFFLDKWIDFKSGKTVLDIGANIGQFSVTLASIFPSTKIWCFEPNPIAFELLKKNVAGRQIKCFNYGIGVQGSFPFFYVPGFSCKGSFIASNASINLTNIQKEMINVDVLELNDHTIQKLDILSCYDLVKIDVEGFEYEVLDALACIQAKFVYIEFSIGRSHKYTFPNLIDRINKIFGPMEVLYCDCIDTSDKKRTIGNILAMSIHSV
jgi:FkbM family methyltransferase